ncbi:hypothetical protein BOTBODRAFT_26874 [Botryobasidium botryosum FD-172 SS1]|uniref:NAD(P)-binding protein n=1 Tax=Botryobasidium botryosum (strain FD-172 SS1) TaxID=930990 RepID=A0A067MYQ8_BOTB1|nr:hypothetical protein BOTBODRAFT_26874 [Botryobasidium botryosum FD-172 SS1]
MPSVKSNGRIAVVFGASRGLGKDIALRLAKEGYAVGVAAKSTEDKSSGVQARYKLDGTIESVVREIEAFGGQALALPWDAVTSTFESINALLTKITTHFPAPAFHLHSIIYNAGALSWRSIPKTDMKKFDLLWSVNARGSFVAVRESLTWLRKAEESRNDPTWTPKIIIVAPPIYSRFFRGKVPYAMSKIPMTALVMGLPVDISRAYGPSCRITPVGLWPATSIQSAATASMESNPERDGAKYLRRPEIWSEAVYRILSDEDKEKIQGRPLIDEDYLRERWAFEDQDFAKYRLDPNVEPKRAVPKQFPDLRVEEEDEELISTEDLERMRHIFDSEKTKAKL